MQLKELNEVISIHDGDAILMAQKLTMTLGLAVGTSSGCNFLAALQAQEKLGKDAVVVTIFCDDNKKYLSTILMGSEPVREDYLSVQVDLCNIRSFRRAGQLQ